MTWQRVKLRFPDKATADAQLVGLINVDTIGTVEGESGWRVNFAFEEDALPVTLEPYRIPPTFNESRVWFDHTTTGELVL